MRNGNRTLIKEKRITRVERFSKLKKNGSNGNFLEIEQYLKKSSWRTKENANFNYAYTGLQSYLTNRILANYSLSKLDMDIRKAHMDGDIHIHNLEGGSLIPYCHGGNLLGLLTTGIRAAGIYSKPARHFNTAVDHVVNYLFISQLEFSGAQAFSDFDTILAPFIHYDDLPYNEVKQNMQRLEFNLNFTCRQAYQSPFTNLTFNITCPSPLKDQHIVIGGEVKDETYSEFDKESEMINIALAEILRERDAAGNPLTFPIPTINISKNFDWNSKAVQEILKTEAELAPYYFMNYIGTGIDENTVRAMCCRLNLDMSKIKVARGYWNMFSGTGSLGVVSLNMGRLGYLARSEKSLFTRLDRLLDLAIRQLKVKRKLVTKAYQNGLLPFSTFNGLNLDYYFNTVGLIGLNEMCMNLFNEPLSNHGDYVKEVLAYITKSLDEITDGSLWNLEMTPAEGSSYKLALIDRKTFKNIFTMGTSSKPYYTALLIPPNEEIDVFDRVEIEKELLPLFTGGTVFRTFFGEKLPVDTTSKFLQKLTSTKIPYFDLTSIFSICKKDSSFHPGKKEKCPTCGSDTEIFSRVVGYYRPVSKYNPGKEQEFKERKMVGGNDLNVM